MKKLTEKQAMIFSFIKSFVKDRGYPPTCREISDAFGNKSANAAYETLLRLQRKGLIRVDTNQARSIVILDEVEVVSAANGQLLCIDGPWDCCETEQAIAMISTEIKRMSAEKVMAVARFIEAMSENDYIR